MGKACQGQSYVPDSSSALLVLPGGSQNPDCQAAVSAGLEVQKVRYHQAVLMRTMGKHIKGST